MDTIVSHNVNVDYQSEVYFNIHVLLSSNLDETYEHAMCCEQFT